MELGSTVREVGSDFSDVVQGKSLAQEMEALWSANLSWLSLMTPRFLADFVGTVTAKVHADAMLYERSCWKDQDICVRETDLKMSVCHPSRD